MSTLVNITSFFCPKYRRSVLVDGIDVRLKDADSQVVQQALMDLDKAYQHFFEGRTDYPRFKRKHGKQSMRYPQRFKVADGRVYLPKVGWIKAVLHRKLEGPMKNATVSKTKTGKFFVSIPCEVEHAGNPLGAEQKSAKVGVDLGLTTFATFSTGQKIDNPRNLKVSERWVKIRQRRLSRKVKGSNSREKTRFAVAAIHEKIANQRKDFHHEKPQPCQVDCRCWLEPVCYLCRVQSGMGRKRSLAR